jgi:hypothetical protein
VASVVALSILVLPGAAVGHSGLVLRGYGTPVVDGTLSAGEWDAAGRFDFNANLPPDLGGGTVPATLYLMNDAQSLYVGLKVDNPSTAGTSSFLATFNNDHSTGGAEQEGDEVMEFERSGTGGVFQDNFIHRTTSGFCLCKDTDYGGTSEGAGKYTKDAVSSFYELSHPLDTGDNAHDFSVGFGSRVGLDFYFIHCVLQCAGTRFPPIVSGGLADLVVVSTGGTTPPDTQITGGPAEGSLSRPGDFNFTFTGTDDAVSADRLTYECKLDDGAFAACTTPHRTFGAHGSHTLSVRAIDDWDLVDATPAERRWRADGVGPTRPRVVGPRVTRSRAPAFRFSATDAVTPRRQIRYRCAFDRPRLHACSARYRQRLRRGRHVLRVKALDSLGNESGVTRVRVRVKRPR